jgi:hypothetical protein
MPPSLLRGPFSQATPASAETARSSPGSSSSDSSRHSSQGAGWGDRLPGSFVRLIPEPRTVAETGQATKLSKRLVDRLYWFRLGVLWASRNDFLSRISDPVPALRNRWIGERTTDELRVDLTDRTEFSFLLMGDTGEGDYSQYALVPPLCSVANQCDAAFVFICSDVMYPVGNVNEYGDKFYNPYRTLQRPIYSVPGNHDWYDGLSAFMYNFGTPRFLPTLIDNDSDASSSGGLLSWPPRLWNDVRRQFRASLWRKPALLKDAAETEHQAAARSAPAQQQPQPQPGPYYVIDTAYVRLVCIDTGIRGNLDEPQGRWLVEVSRDPRPKILLTGKPLLVNGHIEKCKIAGAPNGFDSVLAVVHHREFRYAAVIGGDTHNYQHYPAIVGDGQDRRIVHHIVSGGGGAFMHATHLIPIMEPDQVCGVTEQTYKAYPLRRDSLAAYSQVVQGMIDKVLPRSLRFNLTLDDVQAAKILHEKTGSPLERPAVMANGGPARQMSGTQQWASRLILLIGGRRFHRTFSPFCDWDDPPFFKHFLRIDIRRDGATIRCHAVTGCADDEDDPPVEDTSELRWPDAKTG